MKDVYMQGQMAHREGYEYDQCPYYCDPEAHSWKAGWAAEHIRNFDAFDGDEDTEED